MLVEMLKNIMQLKEQIPNPTTIRWVIGKHMSLIECKDDERPSWPFGPIQEVLWVYKPTEPFCCLFQPLLIFRNVAVRCS